MAMIFDAEMKDLEPSSKLELPNSAALHTTWVDDAPHKQDRARRIVANQKQEGMVGPEHERL